MKTNLSLIFFALLFCFSCSKPVDDAETNTGQTVPDTGEYIMFTLQGDSFDTEKFAMTGIPKASGGNFSANKKFLSLSTPSNGYAISAYLSFTAQNETVLSLDTVNHTSSFILSGQNKGYYFMKSVSGQLNLNHYPDSVNDYAEGTFSGTYINIHTQTLYTLTGGTFRIKRNK